MLQGGGTLLRFPGVRQVLSPSTRSAAPHLRAIGPADVHTGYAAPVRLPKSAALPNSYSPGGMPGSRPPSFGMETSGRVAGRRPYTRLCPQCPDQRAAQRSPAGHQAHLVGWQGGSDGQDAHPVGQRAGVEDDAGHDADTETKPDHADNGLVARDLGVDPCLDPQVAEPTIHTLPGHAAFGQNHGNVLPGRRRDGDVQQGNQLGLIVGGNENQGRDSERTEIQVPRQSIRPGGNGQVLVAGQHSADGVFGVAGAQLDFNPRVVPAKIAEDIVKKTVARRHRAKETQLPAQFCGTFQQRQAHHLPLLQDVAGVGMKQRSCRCQADTAVVAQK